MCRTPQPKIAPKSHTYTQGAILSSMDSTARKTFAERANQADERRQARQKYSQQHRHSSNARQ